VSRALSLGRDVMPQGGSLSQTLQSSSPTHTGQPSDGEDWSDDDVLDLLPD
jgi:hypothetical protein